MNQIDNFTNRKIVVLHEATRAVIAARAMCEHRIGSVLVTNHKSQIVGILTDRDLVCALQAQQLSLETPLSAVMTSDPVTVDENASIEDIIELMKTNGIRRIPIIRKLADSQQKCIGIVTLDDLLVAQSVNLDDIAKIVSSQMIRKKRVKADQTAIETKSEKAMEVFTEDFAFNLSMDFDTAETFIRFVLTSITQRLHFTAALYLASRLPKALEKEIIECATGPDHTITALHILNSVATLLHTDESDAHEKLIRFWSLLERGVGAEHTHHILHQLPKDIRSLFSLPASIGEEQMSSHY